MKDNQPQILHNLGWLARTPEGITLSDKITDEVIKDAKELSAGRYELHWFSDFSHAKSFATGIRIAGRNSITSTIGLGAVSQAVLVSFADEDPVNTTSLNDAVKLIEHFDASKRQSKIIWNNEIKNILSIAPGRNNNTSAPPIRILEEKNDSIKVELKYGNWFFHPEYWTKFNKFNAVFKVNISKSKNGLKATFLSDARILEEVNNLPETTLNEVTQFLKDNNAYFDEGNIAFNIDNNIVQAFEDLLPVLQDIGELIEKGVQIRKIEQVRNDPNNKKIEKIIQSGGYFSKDKGQWYINSSDGKNKTISENRIKELIQAEMVPDIFPKIDYSEMKM